MDSEPGSLCKVPGEGSLDRWTPPERERERRERSGRSTRDVSPFHPPKPLERRVPELSAGDVMLIRGKWVPGEIRQAVMEPGVGLSRIAGKIGKNPLTSTTDKAGTDAGNGGKNRETMGAGSTECLDLQEGWGKIPEGGDSVLNGGSNAEEEARRLNPKTGPDAEEGRSRNHWVLEPESGERE